MGIAFKTRRTSLFFKPIQATGGTIEDIVIDGIEYRVHSFTTLGTSTFEVEDAGTKSEVEYLIVAGGGGGGSDDAGGGGAGGLLTNVFNLPFAVNAQSYSIVVGNGGAPGAQTGGQTGNCLNGSNGGDSSAFGFTAIGGGFGAGQICDGGNGGSGGGGGHIDGSRFTVGGTGVAGPPRQGFNGGGGQISGTPWAAGGGGGAGGAGTNGTATVRGVGGPGIDLSAFFPNWGTNSSNTTTGTRGWFAGGGGGGFKPSPRAAGGVGGGGFGGNDENSSGAQPPTVGLANTGGGGGGSGQSRSTTLYQGKAGGSGIVIIRYPLQQT